MKKEISFKIASDREVVLNTRTSGIPEFADMFLAPAVERVRGLVREKKVKSLGGAIDLLSDIVDEEFTYFLRHNDSETKNEILEWLVECVVGGYLNHFVKEASAKAFAEPPE